MAPNLECYVDTSAFVAFLDSSDSYHRSYLRLFANPPQLITSALVIAEGHAWFLRRYDARRAIQVIGFVEAVPRLKIVNFGENELSFAAHVIRRFADQKLSMADAHGLQIMKDRRITTCWSTDRHLVLGGAHLVF